MSTPLPPTVSLDGEWELREAIGETWRWYVAAAPPGVRNSVSPDSGSASPAVGWMPVRVPGSVVGALERAGRITDPRVGFGSQAAEWTGARSWVHRRVVEVGAEWEGVEAVLELDGVDPAAIVHWNGEVVAEVEGLYRSHRLSIGRLSPGRHVLAIVIEPRPPVISQVGRTEDVRLHGPRVGAGWDFCPPFPHQGIWRSVRLAAARRSTRPRVSVRPPEEDGSTWFVTVEGEIDLATTAPSVSLVREGEVVATMDAFLGDGRWLAELCVDDPELWWPNRHGRPALYDVIIDDDGVEHRRRIGFRTVDFERAPGAPEASLPYRAVVNGVAVPLVGWNWAPVDAQFGETTTARLHHLLDLAQFSGARLLRVWGGGLVETEEFYDACDERGLMVWQEFSQSSSGMQSAPTDDPAYLRSLDVDAREVVPARRHHPSLVMWGGGNELEDDLGPLATERSAALRILRDIVHELDPTRHWLPTSPTGPVFHHRLDVILAAPDAQHDVHGPWEHQGLEAHHTLANAGTSLAHTEFGVEGMTNRRSHQALVPVEQRMPIDRSNPLSRHLGEWWNNAHLVSELLPGADAELESMRAASQWLQATGLAVSVEADRRRWPRCSMVLPWQLAESYPNTWCTAAVDFRGESKPAFAAVARAFADDRATIRVERSAWRGRTTACAEAWVWSVAGRGPGTVELSAVALDGTVLDRAAGEHGEVRDPAPVVSIEIAIDNCDELFVWRAIWRDNTGAIIDDERVLATTADTFASLLTAPRTTIAVSAHERGWTLRNDGPVAALGIVARDDRPAIDARPRAVVVDSHVLLPGESCEAVLIGDGQSSDVLLESFSTDPQPAPAWRPASESEHE